jgi:hypothetical protein
MLQQGLQHCVPHDEYGWIHGDPFLVQGASPQAGAPRPHRRPPGLGPGVTTFLGCVKFSRSTSPSRTTGCEGSGGFVWVSLVGFARFIFLVFIVVRRRTLVRDSMAGDCLDCIDWDPVAHLIESCPTGETGGVGPVSGDFVLHETQRNLVFGTSFMERRFVCVCCPVLGFTSKNPAISCTTTRLTRPTASFSSAVTRATPHHYYADAWDASIGTQ